MHKDLLDLVQSIVTVTSLKDIDFRVFALTGVVIEPGTRVIAQEANAESVRAKLQWLRPWLEADNLATGSLYPWRICNIPIASRNVETKSLKQ